MRVAKLIGQFVAAGPRLSQSAFANSCGTSLNFLSLLVECSQPPWSQVRRRSGGLSNMDTLETSGWITTVTLRPNFSQKIGLRMLYNPVCPLSLHPSLATARFKIQRDTLLSLYIQLLHRAPQVAPPLKQFPFQIHPTSSPPHTLKSK